MRTRWAVGVVAGILLGLGAVMAIEASTDDASAQSGFTVSAAQLQINQKISQAAVRRSNRSLNYLAPIRTSQTDNADDGTKGVTPLSQITGSGKGWTSSQIADSAVTTAKLNDGAVTASKLANPPLFATVAPANATPTIVRGSGATAVTRVVAGSFSVTFNRDVSGCTWLATYGQPDNSFVDAKWATTRGRAAANEVGVVIRDFNGGQVDGDGFHLQVLCP